MDREEKGYLVGDFKVFYLEEMNPREIQYHYHRFDKLILLLDGSVEYAVEGKEYSLLPGDVVLVPRGASHRLAPVRREGEVRRYVRLVIYLSPEYLTSLGGEDGCLRDCFQWAEAQRSYVIRPGEREIGELAGALKAAAAGSGDGFDDLLRRALLIRLLIHLTRTLRDGSAGYADTSRCNEKIVDVIRYINEHLAEELTLDRLAEGCYLSKYHMMRQFKAETGYTVGEYISRKRLLRARALLKQGWPVTRAYLDSGFRDHSTFVRAYKKLFGEMPSQTKA